MHMRLYIQKAWCCYVSMANGTSKRLMQQFIHDSGINTLHLHLGTGPQCDFVITTDRFERFRLTRHESYATLKLHRSTVLQA